MEYRTLGALAARDGGRPVALGGRRQHLVLAVLLQHANRPVTTDRLVDAVWGDAPPATARKTLQVYVSRLRHALGVAVIESLDHGYLLHTATDEVDAERFTRLAGEGRRKLTTDPAAAADALRAALAQWRGSPWGSLGDEPALQASREQLLERRLEALEDRIEADLVRGATEGLSSELDGLLAEHPLRERLSRLAMLLLYRQGRQAEALSIYQQLRGQLTSELGIEPSPQLQRLHERILQQDPVLEGPVPAAAAPPPAPAPSGPARNPYRGLQAFAEADAADFFGREELIGQVVARLGHEQLLVLVGPSGCGKSSIVRAGVVPAVRGRGGWVIATMVPGSHPFEALEAALLHASPSLPASLREERRGDDLDLLRAVLRVRPDDASLLLVVDQLEELFLLTDRAERRRFVRNLVEAVEDPAARLTVLATVRADLLDRPLEEPGLGPLIAAGLVSVPPLSPAQLEGACVRPAAGVGVAVAPELAAELVAEVADRPGALPLFEYALTECFDARGGGALTLAGYRGIGGLRGALARRADATYDALPPAEQEVARQVFLRLVTIGDGVDDTRRRVHRVELEQLPLAPEAVTTVLERFGRARLLSFDRDALSGMATVEVAHEALLRAWPRLRSWIDEVRDDLRLHASLAVEAAEWERADRHPDYLLTGSRLALYDTWSEDGAIVLTGLERDLVADSRAHHERLRAAERARHEHELAMARRGRRRLRALVVGLTGALALGSVLALVAGWQTADAERARDEALELAQMFRIRELTATAAATRRSDPELSLLLALHAVAATAELDVPVAGATVEALHWGLQAARVPYPVGADGEVVLLEGPEGPRGTFAVDLPVLLELAQAHVDRQLSDEECASYLGPGACPKLPAAFPDDLAWVPPRPVATAGAAPLDGTSVRLLAVGFDELGVGAAREALLERTGIDLRVDLEMESLLERRVATGEADLALVPQPGFVAEFGRMGVLVDLSTYLDVAEVEDAFSSHLVSLGRVGGDGTWPSPTGHVYGLPARLDVKSMVWYPVGAFRAAGYEVPASYQELVELTERIVADGGVPWCHGERDGDASGWPGTDWIEDLVLQESGPEVYDGWVADRIPFSDPQVRRAFERFDELALADGHLHGGRRGALTTWFAVASWPMFDQPPGCWLTHTASFAPLAHFPHGTEVGTDVDWFHFPAFDDAAGGVLGSGDYLVAFTDRPEVREVVRELLGEEWGQPLTGAADWYFPANRRFPLDAYADPHARALAEVIQEALARGTFRFDGSDLMPPTVFGEFWGAMVDYVGDGPANLDELLGRLDRVREEAAADASRAEAGGSTPRPDADG
jgi:DNA-binding SARP family transcriptional activator/ABC-type glycerol-3-phosphate transport system substrate-binding protein